MMHIQREWPTTDQQSLSDLTGPDMRKQMQVLGALFAEAK